MKLNTLLKYHIITIIKTQMENVPFCLVLTLQVDIHKTSLQTRDI